MSSDPINVIHVSFGEHSSVRPSLATGSEFDIVIEGEFSVSAYCAALIEKVFKIPQSAFPGFIDHHCSLVKDPFSWLNRFEKLLAENEDLFFEKKKHSRFTKLYTLIELKRNKIKPPDTSQSQEYRALDKINGYTFDRVYCFKNIKEQCEKLQTFEEKILFLEKQITEYEQNPPHVINHFITDFVKQCQLEITILTRQNDLKQHIAKMQHPTPSTIKKQPVNLEAKSWINIFLQLMRSKGEDGKSGLPGTSSEIAQHICDCYVQMDGTPFNYQTVRTYLSKGDTDGRPKQDKEINLNFDVE